jgi:hypothetical protein
MQAVAFVNRLGHVYAVLAKNVIRLNRRVLAASAKTAIRLHATIARMTVAANVTRILVAMSLIAKSAIQETEMIANIAMTLNVKGIVTKTGYFRDS